MSETSNAIDCDTDPMTIMTLVAHDLAYKPRLALLIDGHETEFEVDTGALIALVGEDFWKKIGSPRISRSRVRLCDYGQRQIYVKGECTVDVQYRSTKLQLALIIVDSGVPLFGLNWIQAFQVDVNSMLYPIVNATASSPTDVHAVEVNDLEVKKVIADHPDIFSPGLGRCSKTKAHLQPKGDVHPRLLKARPVPFARLDAVDREQKRLQELDIITKVDYSDWATPIVIICGDYRATINPRIHVQQHPIPRIEELFAKLQGGTHFSKLDMRDAYLQIELDDESKKLLVINTHKGLFQYNRLCFGPSPAPAIFQKLVDNLVAGITGVAAYLDDIIVTGRTTEDHLSNLTRASLHWTNTGSNYSYTMCEHLMRGLRRLSSTRLQKTSNNLRVSSEK